MRFSRNWIAAYTDLPDDDRAMTETLSMLGLVVDDARALGDDLILDLDLPSNRPDVLNHYELAREVAVASGVEPRTPAAELLASGPTTADLATVVVEDGGGCTRFVARALVDVAVGPSPDWMRERLESIGLRPINNVVDVTNYVLWELGRPMHAYDLDKLADGAIVVRRARDGETVVTLDEQERQLTHEDLVIADAERPVGLAGVMGGADTGVTESTRRVLLECACFAPPAVRQMARRHGMHTDASHRFERGMSYQGIDDAVNRACSLLAEHASASVSASGIDVRTTDPEASVIRLRRRRLAGYLGADVAAVEVLTLLRSLRFGVAVASDDLPIDGYADGDYEVTVPLTRQDITREVDVIEEVARFYGYDKLPSTLPTLRRADRSGAEPVLQRERHLRQLASGVGLWEAITFAFGAEDEQRPFLSDEEPLVYLENPLSEAMAVLRRHLLPGLLGAMARNLNHGEGRVRLFETGRTFTPSAGRPPVERRHVAFAIAGGRQSAHFGTASQPIGMADIKGIVEVIGERMGWPPLSWVAGACPGVQDGTAATIATPERQIGFAGKLSAAAAARWDLETPVWLAELDIDELLAAERRLTEVIELPRFPASSRDVSLSVPADVPWAKIEQSLGAAPAPLLVDFALVDTYRGADADQPLTATIRLTYRSNERTLTSEEIETAHEAVVAHLVAELRLQRR